MCVPNETEDLNLHVFNMITGINESRTLTKHISRKCECKFDSKKRHLNQKWNINKCWVECKNPKKHSVGKKGYFWNPATCSCKNGKYVRSIVSDSVAICDEIIDMAQTVSTKSISRNFYISLSFLLIIIALIFDSILLIVISIYLKKYRLLPIHILPNMLPADITKIL